jgi:hypothetical protein
LYKKLDETTVGVELHAKMDYDANGSRVGARDREGRAKEGA